MSKIGLCLLWRGPWVNRLSRSITYLHNSPIHTSTNRITHITQGCIPACITQYRNPTVLSVSPCRSVSNIAKSEDAERLGQDYLSTLTDEERASFVQSELSKLSDLDKKRLRVIEMEYDTLFSTGVKVPDEMDDIKWYTLLQTPTHGSRRRLLRYWFKIEKINLSEKRKKQKRQEAHQERRAKKKLELEKLGVEQGLAAGQVPIKETISLFVRPQTMNMTYYNNLAWAMQHGQTLVFDLSFEQHMKGRERSSLTTQLLNCHGVNKLRREPFHMCMTGVEPDGFIARALLKGTDSFVHTAPVSLSQQHYLDIYPREKLVYLSPDARHELTHWNHDDIYIVGGMVDLAVEKPITLAQAKREGIRSAKLPLDKYLMWQTGTKALTLDIMMKILCDQKDTGDWVKALSHLPTRKCQLRPQYTHEYKQLMQDLKNSRKRPGRR